MGSHRIFNNGPFSNFHSPVKDNGYGVNVIGSLRYLTTLDDDGVWNSLSHTWPWIETNLLRVICPELLNGRILLIVSILLFKLYIVQLFHFKDDDYDHHCAAHVLQLP